MLWNGGFKLIMKDEDLLWLFNKSIKNRLMDIYVELMPEEEDGDNGDREEGDGGEKFDGEGKRSQSVHCHGFRSPKIHNPTRIQNPLTRLSFLFSSKNPLHHLSAGASSPFCPPPSRPTVDSSLQRLPQPYGHQVPQTETRRQASPQKSQLETSRSVCVGKMCAWGTYTPNQPNEGSVKRRNEKKRIKQQRAFIMAEKRKRKAQFQEAKRKKIMKRVDRKMAAVARERAWQERLVELKRIEEEKKKAAMA
ncbi:hypothetical protein DH2020_040559 [Rehmannia glutinosa]|uniref:Uncharacterized protein n=1 Tax=Rehmannia glutinosa TaxID=99300 RepID=A0ABR0USK6_REHGL